MNINDLNGTGTAPDAVTKLGEDKNAEKYQRAIKVAHQFEEIFLNMMVQSFRKSQLDDSGGMFGNSPGSSTYEEWFDEHMSAHLAKSTTIGIADTLIRDFRRLGELPKAEGVDHVA
jgi:peptidoglycan hydrolase FlgJ